MESEAAVQVRRTSNSSENRQRSLWDVYCSFVQRNHVPLELMDAGLSRILFWAPTTSDGAEQRHRQREVLYGILSLHRLAMDTALQQQESSSGRLPEDYGMTVRPNPDEENQKSSTDVSTHQWSNIGVSPTAIRISLTVLQSVLPSVLELSRSSNQSLQETDQRQRRVRLYLERIKFALRILLLGTYWKQMKQQQKHKTKSILDSGTPPLSLGIMTEGGLFHGIHEMNDIPTVAQEDAQWERRTYVGRRTGRTVVRRTPNGQDMPTTSSPSSFSRLRNLSVLIGEILYAYRPLYWANAEAKGSASYRNWLITIVMDLVSLQCCRMNSGTSSNPATKTELSRRKMRLLLYLLRTPVWDRWTDPGSTQMEELLDRVPILGRLAATYLRDWLWYMKHPYVAEQG